MRKDIAPKFMSSVLFVRNIDASKRFYVDVLGQKIEMDSGRYVGFEGGLGIWEGTYALETIYSERKDVSSYGLDNCEVYFEIEELEPLCEKLKREHVPFVHAIREHTWGQRSFRIYDPDGHLVECGEPMSAVVHRYHDQGWTIQDIVDKTTLPMDMVKRILNA